MILLHKTITQMRNIMKGIKVKKVKITVQTGRQGEEREKGISKVNLSGVQLRLHYHTPGLP